MFKLPERLDDVLDFKGVCGRSRRLLGSIGRDMPIR